MRASRWLQHLTVVLAVAVAGTPGVLAAENVLMLQVTLVPLRDVWYVGEPITFRIIFLNLGTETTLVNVSPPVLARMVFDVSYQGTAHRFAAPQRVSDTVKSLMLGSAEETFVEGTLVDGAISFGASFDQRYYGELPQAPTEMEVRVTYINEDTGVRNVVPFWTGTAISDPVTVRIASR